MNQTCENGKKTLNFGPDFGPNLVSMFFVLTVLDVTYCSKLSLYVISRKTNKPSLRKWQKKNSFGPDFGPFNPNLGLKTFLMHFTPNRCLTLLQAIIACNCKGN